MIAAWMTYALVIALLVSCAALSAERIAILRRLQSRWIWVAAMDSIVRERTFVDYSSYVAKVGRARFVEIHVLVAPDSRIDTAAADSIRRDIATRLNAVFPNFWLTVDFTADRSWL